jgi:hypothetical protein
MSTFYFKKKFNKRIPYYLVFIGSLVPIGVAIHKRSQMKRLEDGVKKDIDRIKEKGRKFSEIPKSF